MNYTEIYNKIYKSLLQDGYSDDHHEYGIVQITRSAASDIAYHLWRFLLACENHPLPAVTKEANNIVQNTLESIKLSLEKTCK